MAIKQLDAPCWELAYPIGSTADRHFDDETEVKEALGDDAAPRRATDPIQLRAA